MNTHRTRIGREIVAEFVLPDVKTNNVAIIASGMPSNSSKVALMGFLAQQGFIVIHPRYRGSWESDGEFLKHEPTKDIELVIKHMQDGIPFESLWEEKMYKFPKRPQVYIFAGSFGGPAGLLLSSHPAVKQVVCVAPVVDWTMESKAEPLDWLYKIVRSAYGQGYRVQQKNWDKLGKGTFYDPTKQPQNIDGSKVIIFHAMDDESIPHEGVVEFAAKHNIRLHSKRVGGHLSMSKIPEAFYWNRIQKFWNKK